MRGILGMGLWEMIGLGILVLASVMFLLLTEDGKHMLASWVSISGLAIFRGAVE